MYHAVCMTSEASERYLMLLNAATPEELVAQVRSQIDDEEFAYIYDVEVDSQDPKQSHVFQRAIYAAVEKFAEEYELAEYGTGAEEEEEE